MKIGVCAVLLGDRPLDKALEYFKNAGIEAAEIGAGGYPGKAHCDPAALLADESKITDAIDKAFIATGSVDSRATAQELADALQAQEGIALDKRRIILDESIKNVGVYTIRCKLGYEVTGSFRLDVQEL